MARTFNKNRPKIRIKQDRGSDASIPFANLVPVRRLADYVASCPEIREPICRFIVTTGRKSGYKYHEETGHATMAKSLVSLATRPRSISGLNAAISCCEHITKAFSEELSRGRWPRAELAQRFSSGIAEAIVRAVLLRRGLRKKHQLIPNARVWVSGKPLTRRNIDFFWARPVRSRNPQAEVYECKTNPTRAFEEFVAWQTNQNTTTKAAWEQSKYYLMQRLKELLDQKGVPTRVRVVTLLTQKAVNSCMRELPHPVSGDIVYAREAVFTKLYDPDHN